MGQKQFNILSLEKSGNKMIVTILGGNVEIDIIPGDLNKEDYQVLETLTSTGNPAVFDAEYKFIRRNRYSH